MANGVIDLALVNGDPFSEANLNSLEDYISHGGDYGAGAPSGTPADGATWYDTTNKLVYRYNTGATAWVKVDALGAWTTWTPVVTQSATPTFTNTRSVYIKQGRRVKSDGLLTFTATPGTAGNAIVMTLPFTAAGTTVNSLVGKAIFFDSSAGFYYYADLVIASSTTVKLLINTNGAAATFLGVTSFTAAIATGDTLSYSMDFEATT